ncbi:cytochrome P450 [Paenibacillus sp. OV219]|uniref:cytochrome P450 n=1 Tax=Paenibacillus sp. OV219 TaxID=1884377 RepID=UPI0008C0205C|nr:cytochrome P450 [Paenibacillus sp. OV219]SEO72979.1 Cytochrome P450 [Paenibacillus sp. OV219]
MMKWASQYDLLPLERYKQQRAEGAAVYNSDSGSWSVYRHDSVKRILADYEHFSSQMQEKPSEDEPIEGSILRRDPPKHKQMRSLIAKAFSAKVIEAMEPRIRKIAEELLDRAAAAGSFEVVSDFASPLPVIVIAEMLGIPPEDRELFKRWSDDLVGKDYSRYLQCQKEMTDYFRIQIKERSEQPQDDLITALVQSCMADDNGLSELEVIGMCILLLVAGNETTTNLISSMIMCLESSPETYDELRRDRALIPGTVEETLRFCSPVQLMERRVKADMDWNGHLMKEGQRVYTFIGAANHDENVFAGPEKFDIRRSPNPHLAFGQGIHFCLGAMLARLEARVALNVIVDRIERLERTDDESLERLESDMMFGIKHMRIRV